MSEHLGTAAAEVVVDGRWGEYDHIGLVRRFVAEAGAEAPADSRAFQAVLDRALVSWIAEDAADGWAGFASGALAAVQDLAGRLDGSDAVVSTSGGVIAAVAASLLHTGPQGVVALNRVVVNAGLTTLLVGRSGITLLTFNEHTHLTGGHAHLRTYR